MLNNCRPSTKERFRQTIYDYKLSKTARMRANLRSTSSNNSEKGPIISLRTTNPSCLMGLEWENINNSGLNKISKLNKLFLYE